LKYFIENGGLQTIRSSDQNLNPLRTEFENMFAYTEGRPTKEGDAMASNISVLSLSRDTKLGKDLDALFDYTEVLPKTSMFYSDYVYFTKKGFSEQEAAEMAMNKVLMAHATYDNLSQLGAVVNEVFPFAKYYANIPRMALYSFTNNMPRMFGMLYMIHGNSYMSALWGDNVEDKPSATRMYIPGTSKYIYTGGWNPWMFTFEDYYNSPFLGSAFYNIATKPVDTLATVVRDAN
jgi:hypothetical protein